MMGRPGAPLRGAKEEHATLSLTRSVLPTWKNAPESVRTGALEAPYYAKSHRRPWLFLLSPAVRALRPEAFFEIVW